MRGMYILCLLYTSRDREMAEADTSGRSEEKSEKQTKFPAFHAAQTEDIFEESGKAEQQPVNQQEKKPEKKTSLLRKLDEKKKECAERDAKQQVDVYKRQVLSGWAVMWLETIKIRLMGD